MLGTVASIFFFFLVIIGPTSSILNADCNDPYVHCDTFPIFGQIRMIFWLAIIALTTIGFYLVIKGRNVRKRTA